MFEITCEPLPSVKLLQPRRFFDPRGEFVKTYAATVLQSVGIDFVVREQFFSVSHRGVLRGMHFQVPPHSHAKLVYCVTGTVIDVVVDLRSDSATHGRHAAFELSAANRSMAFIPPGFAHGFLSMQDDSCVMYSTTTEHSGEHDKGIRWDSFGFDWPVSDPVISDRDAGFPRLEEYRTPF